MTIEQIAAATNTPAAVVESMLYLMAGAMREDGVVEMFRAADRETQIKFIAAYMTAAAEKVQIMGEQVLNSIETRERVESTVYDILAA